MARTLRSCLIALVAACVCLGVAPGVATAGSRLEEAKQGGLIGERPDGYVGAVRADATEATLNLVREVNAERLAAYTKIAGGVGIGVGVVAVRSGQRLIERAGGDEYVFMGTWKKKE